MEVEKLARLWAHEPPGSKRWCQRRCQPVIRSRDWMHVRADAPSPRGEVETRVRQPPAGELHRFHRATLSAATTSRFRSVHRDGVDRKLSAFTPLHRAKHREVRDLRQARNCRATLDFGPHPERVGETSETSQPMQFQAGRPRDFLREVPGVPAGFGDMVDACNRACAPNANEIPVAVETGVAPATTAPFHGRVRDQSRLVAEASTQEERCSDRRHCNAHRPRGASRPSGHVKRRELRKTREGA